MTQGELAHTHRNPQERGDKEKGSRSLLEIADLFVMGGEVGEVGGWLDGVVVELTVRIDGGVHRKPPEKNGWLSGCH